MGPGSVRTTRRRMPPPPVAYGFHGGSPASTAEALRDRLSGRPETRGSSARGIAREVAPVSRSARADRGTIRIRPPPSGARPWASGNSAPIESGVVREGSHRRHQEAVQEREDLLQAGTTRVEPALHDERPPLVGLFDIGPNDAVKSTGGSVRSRVVRRANVSQIARHSLSLSKTKRLARKFRS